MKKNLDLLLLAVSELLLLLVFAFMALPGATGTLIGITAKWSVYNAVGDGIAMPIVAMILVILSVLALGLVIASKLLNLKIGFGDLLVLCVAGLAILAGVFFFLTCTGDYKGLDLGVGAILCGILGILAGLACGFVGAKKLMK